MKPSPIETQRMARWLTLALLLSWPLACPVQASSPQLVGDWGRTERLLFEGIQSYSKEEILTVLTFRLDFQLAAHPAGPLTNYLHTLQQMVLAGYRRGGFPDATVATSLDLPTQRLVVRVQEGSRYTCGDIRVLGGQTLANAAARAKLVHAVIEGEIRAAPLQRTNASTPSTKALGSDAGELDFSRPTWIAGAPAPFDEDARNELSSRVRDAMANLGYFYPRFHLRMVPDPTRRQAELCLELESEGLRGVIEQFVVLGTRQNSPTQVVAFLGLKPGVEARAELLADLRDRLWKSGRFLSQELSLSSLPEPGKLKLTLTLRELEQAPPLAQEFSKEMEVWRKFRQFLTDFEKQADDLVVSFELFPEAIGQKKEFSAVDLAFLNLMGPDQRGVGAELVLSPAGSMFLHRAAASNQPPAPRYALVAASRLLGVYSTARQRKLAFERTAGQMVMFFNLVPTGAPPGENQFDLQMGFGGSTGEAEQAFRLRIQVEPVALVYMLAGTNHTSSLDQGILTLEGRNTEDHSRWRAQLEAGTGRLIKADYKSPEFAWQAGLEAGGFARRLQEIAAATETYRNEAATGQLFSSAVTFLAVDLARLLALTETKASPARTDRLAAVVEKLAPGQWLAPLEQLPWARFFRRTFEVPWNFAERADDQSPPLERRSAYDPEGLLVRFILQNAETFWVRGSWPWTLARETAFVRGGGAQYTVAEVQRLASSPEMGPLGSFLGAKLFAGLSPGLASPLATRGVSLLSLGDFRKDWRVLLRKDSLMGQVLQNGLKALATLSEEDLATLTALLPAPAAACVRQGAELARSGKDGDMAEVLWPAVAQHWDRVFKPALQAAFASVLADVALALQNKDQLEPAAQLSRSAMDLLRQLPGQEHLEIAGVLHGLARSLEKRKKFSEAATLYHAAAEQGYAHALSDLGRLYYRGEGVAKDAAEAARWYRKAAEKYGRRTENEDALAWLLATCPVAEVRDGRRAVTVAEKAVARTHRQFADFLDTLAAAYAETGEFSQAAVVQQEALALQPDDQKKTRFQGRLQLYQARQPYRQE